jgi:hypothetical protein
MKHYGGTGAAIMMALILLINVGAPARADNELAAAAPTFYVLVPGNDASVSALAHQVAGRLQALFDRAGGRGTVWVVPRLSWGPNDLGDQCLNDPGLENSRGPQILGGIILESTNTYTATDGFVIWEHGWTKLSSNAQLVSCKAAGFKKPTITWISDDLTGYGSRNGLRVETTTAGLFAVNPHSAVAVDYASIGLAVGSNASTIPPVNDATTANDALGHVVNELFLELTAGCAAPSMSMQPMCAKLGLAAAAGVPLASPAPANPPASSPPR